MVENSSQSNIIKEMDIGATPVAGSDNCGPIMQDRRAER